MAENGENFDTKVRDFYNTLGLGNEEKRENVFRRLNPFYKPEKHYIVQTWISDNTSTTPFRG
jgi:hypothetical protein